MVWRFYLPKEKPLLAGVEVAPPKRLPVAGVLVVLPNEKALEP